MLWKPKGYDSLQRGFEGSLCSDHLPVQRRHNLWCGGWATLRKRFVMWKRRYVLSSRGMSFAVKFHINCYSQVLPFPLVIHIKKKFIYLFLAVLGLCLGLRCCSWAFSRCSDPGLLSSCGVQASHCGGFSCCKTRALGTLASVVAACGLSSCSSQALEHRLSSCGTQAQLSPGM